ncbi:MAG: NTP transferase domain-containing protein [Saccharofermentans sp.]|nr:NTP transferase domain-containing protein [Saccharofermentans sp.]
MNIQESDVLRTLLSKPYVNQRILSESTGHSLGVINRSIKNLTSEGYLNNNVQLTKKAIDEINARSPENAVILAAGFGMRMVPINLSTPKALLEVNGEILIERIIRQLISVGIKDITVVVGFMKESFEYLIDEYGVDLVVNDEYAAKNNLHSLALVADRIHNTYIVPCDIRCEVNPFSNAELYSWYMVSDSEDEESSVRVNRKTELVKISDKENGSRMIGIAYVTEPESVTIREQLKEMDNEHHADCFWEETLFSKDRMILPARIVSSSDFVEINTYEQLRELDSGSNHLKSDAMVTITSALNCKEKDIVDINVLKKGMTNRSFIFTVKGNKYIMRIPGEGTEKLINRNQEAEVFRTISGLGLCDDPVYINPENGFKITKYLEGIRSCDPYCEEDLEKCMTKLKAFHDMKLKVAHTFDVFGQIEFYEKLWDGTPSVYRDYKKTKANVLSLKKYIDRLKKDNCLTHIDAVPDNFLFYQTGKGEELQLTDWEYSGMQDPHVDIAMFCIYSLYDKNMCDRLIDIYFKGRCDKETRTKIYCYIAMCGLLWSNWCEYKRKLGVEFGEYSLRQYRYAKDFYRFAEELMEEA